MLYIFIIFAFFIFIIIPAYYLAKNYKLKENTIGETIIISNTNKPDNKLVIEISDAQDFIDKFIRLFNGYDFTQKIIDTIDEKLSKYICIDKLKIDKKNLKNYFETIHANGIDIYKLFDEEKIIEIFAINMPERFSILKFKNIAKIKLSFFMSYLANKYNLYNYYNKTKNDINKCSDDIVKFFVLLNELLAYDESEFHKRMSQIDYFANFINYNKHKDKVTYVLVENSDLSNLCEVVDVVEENSMLNTILIKNSNDVKEIFIDMLKPYVCDELLNSSTDLSSFELKEKLERNGIDVEKLLKMNIDDYYKRFIPAALQNTKIISTEFPFYSVFIDKKELKEYKLQVGRYTNTILGYRVYLTKLFVEFLESNYIVNNNPVKFFVKEII